MDLSGWANVADIVGGLAVFAGIAFAIVQLMHYRRKRLELATIELARSFENPELARSLRLVLSMPGGLGCRELRARGAELEDAAMLVSLTIESVAVMCHRRIIDIDVVWDLMGGVILTGWSNLRGWVMDLRVEQGNPKFDEWFEWLANELARRHGAGSPQSAPAVGPQQQR